MIALGSLIGLSDPISAAIGIEDSRIRFGGNAYRYDDHGSYTEHTDIENLNTVWRMRGEGTWRRSFIPDHTGVVILESFGSRKRRPERKFVAFDFIVDEPASGPILRLDKPFRGVPIARLSDPVGRVSAVPLPPTLPFLTFSVFAIGVLGRRSKKNRIRDAENSANLAHP
jgi:hypothetical protein